MPEETRQSISYRAIWEMLSPLVRVHQWTIVTLVFLALIISSLYVSEPYVYGKIIDSVTYSVGTGAGATTGFARIIPYLVYWVFVVFASTLFAALFSWISWYVGNRLEGQLSEVMLQKFLSLSVRRFSDEHAGAMLQKLSNGKDAIWVFSMHLLRSFLQSGSTFVAIVAVGMYLDWRLMLAALAIVPIDMALGMWNVHLSLRRQEAMNEKWEQSVGLIGDAFTNITSVQGAAGERRIISDFTRHYATLIKEQLKLNYQWASFDAGIGGIYVIGRLVIFFVGIRLVLAGSVSLGTLVMFLGFAGSLYGNVSIVLGSLPEVGRSLNRFDRLARVWKEVPEVHDAKDAIPAPNLVGDVELDNVWFSYADAGKPVLRGVSMKIPAGKTFAIVGESGAGKSTLAKLLVRFADPTKGSIRFDGVNFRDMQLTTLRPQVGFVMQENMLFHETILYNLRFARPDATRDEVVEAAKRAQAHEFITKLPNGYDTVVGERGVKLSGGQKQRVALARVLLANPPILVLDEATSALDSKTEHDLQHALREVMKGRTTVVIAHRLSTVMDADNILVMDKGRVVDQGTHAELINRDNLYKKFWEIQAGGYV